MGVSINMINTRKRIQIPNRKIKSCAEQFKNAAELLYSQPPGSGVVLPLITNAVFAIELYLKSLNAQIICSEEYSFNSLNIVGGKVSAKVNCRIHSLTKLFNSINKDIKKQLASYYKKSKLFSTTTQLGTILKKYNKLYTKARFSFEKNQSVSGTSLTELIKLVNFLHAFVDRLQYKEYIEDEQKD